MTSEHWDATNKKELAWALTNAIHEYRALAAHAAKNPSKLTVLGDTQSLFLGNAEGLHRALMMVDSKAGMALGKP